MEISLLITQHRFVASSVTRLNSSIGPHSVARDVIKEITVMSPITLAFHALRTARHAFLMILIHSQNAKHAKMGLSLIQRRKTANLGAILFLSSTGIQEYVRIAL